MTGVSFLKIFIIVNSKSYDHRMARKCIMTSNLNASIGYDVNYKCCALKERVRLESLLKYSPHENREG